MWIAVMIMVRGYYPETTRTLLLTMELARSDIVRNGEEPHAITYCEIESAVHERLRFMGAMCRYIEDED